MADLKITQLGENTTPASTDLLVLVDDPSGSPVTQKVQLGNLFKTADLKLGATYKLYFDGGGDTYAYESEANQLDVLVGGTLRFRQATTYAYFVGQDVLLSPAFKLYFDGGGDTYLVESAAEDVYLYTGGTVAARFTSAQIIAGAGGFVMSTWPTTASAANAQVANGASVKLSTSLRAAKRAIRPLELVDARRIVGALPAITYESAIDMDHRTWPGLVAEDVAAIAPLLATYHPSGELLGVAYDRVPMYLLPVVRDHEARLTRLEEMSRYA